MKYIIINKIIFVSLACLSFSTNAQTMSDPILGLKYITNEVSFEVFDSRKNSKCQLPFIGKIWIYAKASLDGEEYLVVSGFTPLDQDPNQGAKSTKEKRLEPGFGSVVKVSEKSGRCRQVGSPDVVFDGQADSVSTKVLEDLSYDAAQRFKTAYRGSESLNAAMASQGIKENSLPPTIRKYLSK